MFKKAISILLACLLIATSVGITAISVAAADAQQNAGADDLTVTAKSKSNVFAETSATVDSTADRITVSYFVQNGDYKILNAQWELYYDTEYLELVSEEGVNYTDDEGTKIGNMMPFAGDDGTYNIETPGVVVANTSKLSGYAMKEKDGSKIGFVTATFKPLKAGSTEVMLDAQIITLKKGKAEPKLVDESKLVNDEIPYTPEKTQTAVYVGDYDSDVENPDVEPVTTEPVTTEPVTTEPATDPEETDPVVTTEPEPVATTEPEAPVVTDFLKLTATSNLFPEVKVYYYDPIEETVTVFYSIDVTDAYRLVDGQFEVIYDPEVLQLNEADNSVPGEEEGELVSTLVPVAANKSGTSVYTNYTTPGDVIVNFTNMNGIPTSKNGEVTALAKLVFKVVGKGATVVDLKVTKMDISEKGKTTDVANWIVLDADMDNFNDVVAQVSEFAERTTDVSPAGKDPLPESDDVYNLAGSPASVFGGAEWTADNAATDMTKGADGKYSIVLENVPELKNIQFKVLKNHSWDESWGDNGGNFVFNTNGVGDVTVTFDPETTEITVTGDTVYFETELVVDKMYAVGNGEGTWLNGLAWGDAFGKEDNVMTEVSDKVYEITFDDVPAFDNWQIKFAANGNWTSNWGNAKPTTDPETGEEIPAPSPMNEAVDAVYDGGNIVVNVEEDGSTVKAQLDLTNFDFATKKGAKYTITVTPPEAGTLNVATECANSGFSGSANVNGETAVVTFTGSSLTAIQKLISTQFTSTYDPEYLELTDVKMPFVSGDSDNRLEPVFNTAVAGSVKGSVSDLSGFKTLDPAYVELTFKVLKTEGETTVKLDVTDFLVEQDENVKFDAEAVEQENGTTTVTYVDEYADENGKQRVKFTFAPAEGYELEGVDVEGDDYITDPDFTPADGENAIQYIIGADIKVTPRFVKIYVPETTVPETTVPETTVPETTVPATTVAPTTTVPNPSEDATGSTVAPTTAKPATSDSATPDSPTNPTNNGAIQTGSASMAMIILLVLLSGTAAIFFVRRKQDDK